MLGMRWNTYPPATKETHCFDPCNLDVVSLLVRGDARSRRKRVLWASSGRIEAVGRVLAIDDVLYSDLGGSDLVVTIFCRVETMGYQNE